jgi:ferrous-iron efflux pump FieF
MSGAEDGRLARRAATASLAVAGVLITAKLVAWFTTDSIAVLSTLLDSLLDICASGIIFLAVRHAHVPADAEHRFGHGKAEPLAGLAQAAFIFGSALLLVIEALHRFAAPLKVSNPEHGIFVALLSIVLSAALVAYQRRVVARTGSIAISADSLHYASDALLNSAVIVSIALGAWTGMTQIDPLFGIGIAGWVLWSAWKIARQSYDLLMDRELPAADRERIVAIARAHPEVRDVHELRTRSSGSRIFVQMHLELDGAMRLATAHEIADGVEREILAAFPRAEVIIHQDPAEIVEPHRASASA